MNKKDFWTLMLCNFTVVALLIEHLCGLELALELMCFVAIASAIVHIYILRDYVRIPTFVREESTR